ncbi:MAG: tRNA dihydrouridine(20/20a) synthase DusA [Beijerinckiaceae bacterium]
MLTPHELRFSVAPMMDWTDRHCRVLHRVLSRRARLYTEMVTTGAVIHGDRARLIGFSPVEQPVAVQLGGSDPKALAEAARICANEGYIEVNLNCGCPSDRVQGGNFGACLMREPALVAEGVAAMKAAVAVPVTVKCRIGVDDQEPEATLFGFAESVVAAGADALIVHARKAWLQGLSPRENREVPPLDYPLVHRLKQAFPAVPMSINGGIGSLEQAKAHLAVVDGVMLGRAAYQNPELLLGVDSELFGEEPAVADGFAALEAYRSYVVAELARGTRLHAMTKHLMGFFPARPGARLFRRHLSTEGVKAGAGIEVYDAAIAIVRDNMLRREEAVQQEEAA